MSTVVSEELNIYGTPGNQFGNTMVGGDDVEIINIMLKAAFEAAIAGVGNPVVQIGNYKGRTVHEQKAADQIRISLDDDDKAYVKLITRTTDPGMGLVALAGGFKEAGETDTKAADREETEEAKSTLGKLIARHEIARHPVPGDVRVWGGNDRSDGVKKGDIIALSTTAIVPVVRNARGVVEAGDDASGAGWVALPDITDVSVFGIKGHALMLLQAARLAGVVDQLPDSFMASLAQRKNDITVGDADLQASAKALVSGPTPTP